MKHKISNIPCDVIGNYIYIYIYIHDLIVDNDARSISFDTKSDSHVIILIHLHKSNLFAKRRLIRLLYNIPMHVNDFTNQIQISSFKKIIESETYN